ncbi:MAG TPA: hypothetical protein VMV46_04510 [Thermoanaerobaculia bacterium]|nr:hypothetical protein [Thermoanaerobaculia bacterium]
MIRTLALALALAGAPTALAQDFVLEETQSLDFDDPESWAMKYFSSASVMTALGPVRERGAGELELELEGIAVPDLSVEQRMVGFGGLKEEDLNRAPAFGRIRLGAGLGGRFSLTVGWMPPLEIDGVEADLWSLALERPIFAGRRWSLGWRVFGQTGEARGDLTCTAADAAQPPGSPGNAFGCREPSRDEVTLEHLGVELVAGVTLGERWRLHFGAGAVEHDLEFQVDALTFDFLDRTLLVTDGSSATATAGATLRLGPKLALAGELFYSPLDRRRRRDQPFEDPELVRVIDDELLHLRAMVRYRLR